MKTGTLLKLKAKHKDTVDYHLPLGEELVALNDLVGKKVSLKFTGDIYCVDTGKKIKKSFGNGYSWESYITLPECDQCIFQPELCHFARGTCRDSEWGEKHCMQPHVIYISLTSDLKIGITRKTQVPTRWIDQGAVKAIALCEVKDRLTSGLIEVEIAKEMNDKTNWRNMLKNNYKDQDLLEVKKEIISKYSALLEKYKAKISDDKVYEFKYPVEQYPDKVSSFNIKKADSISGKLLGIKGQYLIFDSGVINIRKYQGYEVQLES